MVVVARTGIKVASEVFIATALLHREHPEADGFTVTEIVNRVKRENLFGDLRPGVRVHADLHCIANRPPNSVRHKMLFEMPDRRRRLLVKGDYCHPQRTGNIFPEPGDIPGEYQELIEWAKERYAKGGSKPVRWLDGIFQMAGMGKDLWKGEDPDEYVRKLREGWE